MGVTGLWPLISVAGRHVTPDELRHQVLGVDVSIWLNQIVKGGGGEAVSGRWKVILAPLDSRC
jgi:hypothetical protein